MHQLVSRWKIYFDHVLKTGGRYPIKHIKTERLVLLKLYCIDRCECLLPGRFLYCTHCCIQPVCDSVEVSWQSCWTCPNWTSDRNSWIILSHNRVLHGYAHAVDMTRCLSANKSAPLAVVFHGMKRKCFFCVVWYVQIVVLWRSPLGSIWTAQAVRWAVFFQPVILLIPPHSRAQCLVWILKGLLDVSCGQRGKL